MHPLLLTTVMVLGAGSGIQDGSILVMRNSNKVVGVATGSSITHVAMVMTVNKKRLVYEATPAKVRRLPLSEYCEELGVMNQGRSKKIQLSYCAPKKPLSKDEKARMRSYLESQLGRRYSVRGYVRREPGDGIHCAALVGSAISESGVCRVVNPYGQSPDSLMIGVRILYRPARMIALPIPKTQPTWAQRASLTWRGFKTWCCWSFVESFRFCF